MNKMSSVIRVLNLLHSRDSVTLGEIASICGVSERTAYRYVKTIIDADIPIHFDRRTRAYRLSKRLTRAIGELRLDQVVILGLALNFLARYLNTSQRQIVDDTWVSVLARQPSLTRAADATIRDSVTSLEDLSNLSLLVNSVIIEVAAALETTISIDYHKSNDKSETRTLSRPALHFTASWFLHDLAEPHGPRYRLTTIRAVKAV